MTLGPLPFGVACLMSPGGGSRAAPTVLLDLVAMRRFLGGTAVVLMLSAANPAMASWWLVRSSDGKCLVVDIEPTGKDKNVTKMGQDVYQSAEQAELASKRLCKDAKPGEQSSPHPE
jgi:hypothetical protein